MSDEENFFREEFIKDTLKEGEEQVKKELHDYWNLMNVHSKLLDRVTKGKMSKTSYTWDAISEVLDEVDEGKLEIVFCDSQEEVRKNIKNCEGDHIQQVVYSTYHDALTQICFSCREIRTSLKEEDLE